MPEVPQPKTPEDQERDFRTFVRKLLDAQRFEARAKEPFSLRNLRKTFIAFCDIIAEELGTESCTIHLQLYDPASLNAKELEANIEDQLKKIGVRHGFRPQPEGDPKAQEGAWESFNEFRRPLLESSATFPYWLYSKGASVLFASNPLGPWTKVALSRQHGIADLDTGISKEIYQQNIARIRDHRDHLIIQSARNFRKLGGADPYVWTNTDWEETFRDYYGVPIRIHSLGEAIGILKVENKRHPPGAIDEILQATKVGDFKRRIISYYARGLEGGDLPRGVGGRAARTRAQWLDDLNCSLLSLVYLLEDLDTPECAAALERSATPRDLILLPFPHINYELEGRNKDRDLELAYRQAATKKKPGIGGAGDVPWQRDLEADGFMTLNQRQEDEEKAHRYASLRPSKNRRRPPVQIFAESLAEERKLWEDLNALANPLRSDPRAGITRLVDMLQRLYRKIAAKLNELFPEGQQDLFRESINASTTPVMITGLDRGVTSAREQRYELLVSRSSDDKLPPFLFRLQLSGGGLTQPVKLLAMVAPSPHEVMINELEVNQRESSVLGKPSRGYASGNEWWCLAGVPDNCNIRSSLQNIENIYIGEQVGRRTDTNCIPSFAVDRLAARSQALARALATVGFTDADTRKLSWAALEIGKVLEREIANRANFLLEPIPLTAMEFYRIPISHLGFVDDLQQRRQKSEAVEDDVRQRLNQSILYFGWQESVRAESRTKDYRSYLTRLGERYEGFIRGNMALGLFLLALQVLQRNGDGESEQGGQQQPEGESLLSDLKELKREVLGALEALSGKDKKNQFLAFFPKSIPLGDFRFRTAPISLRKEHLSEALSICIRNLWKEGCLQGPQGIVSSVEFARWRKALKELVKHGEVSEPLREYRNELERLLFRRYDAFAQSSYSLLCQLANCLFRTDGIPAEGDDSAGQEYLSFYRTCYDLKGRLCLSTRAMEETAELSRLKDFFAGEAWARLVEFVDSRGTSDFVEIVGKDVAGKDILLLNPRGLYKRVRMMHHVLRLHVSPSNLEWALGRFDLVGCRATALFKHQVFAVAEYLWNRGDPFFDIRLDAKNFEEFYGSKTWVTAPPWLCLRTRVLDDWYQAVHLSALVDPATVGEKVIRKRVYSPRRLRKYLESRLRKWEGEFADQYRNYAYHRDRMRLEYREWAGSENRGFTTRSGDKMGPPAMSFLFEGVIEVLIRVLRGIESDQLCPTDLEKAVRELLEALVDVLRWAERYTTSLRQGLVQRGGLAGVKFNCSKGAISSLCHSCQSCERLRTPDDGSAWLRPQTCQIYSKARALLSKTQVGGSRACDGLERYLDQERSYFEDLPAGKRFTPLLFVPARETAKRSEESGRPSRRSLREELEDLLRNWPAGEMEQGRLPPAAEGADLLVRLQRQYSAFFTEQGSAPEQGSLPQGRRPVSGSPQPPEGGLWLRGAGEVLGRIENYVLLFSPDPPRSDHRDRAGWTAYDLFHYFHSLIPVEIQVRTQLANTVAEQYHEPLYKGQPGLAVEMGGLRVKSLSRQLGDWDREMDRVYLAVERQRRQRKEGTEEDS